MERDELLPIDYQVGDIVYPKHRKELGSALVLDITEKFVILKLLTSKRDKPTLVPIHDANLLTKDKIGTILHGYKNT